LRDILDLGHCGKLENIFLLMHRSSSVDVQRQGSKTFLTGFYWLAKGVSTRILYRMRRPEAGAKAATPGTKNSNPAKGKNQISFSAKANVDQTAVKKRRG
jgi:hypothetical protein